MPHSRCINSIKMNEELKRLYKEENGECDYGELEIDKTFSFLNDLANRRNLVAHGSSCDILALEMLEGLILKLKLFVKEMDHLAFEKFLPYLVRETICLSTIYDVKGPAKLLCLQLENATICVEDIIIIKRGET